MTTCKLAFIADIHHYSEKLGSSGRAYTLREGSDQKCLKESGAVTDAVFEKLKNSDVSCVCIAGDLTNDGEKCSHEEIYEKISRLNEIKKTYPIVSTHDWCSDNNPRRFDGDKVSNDVETLTPEDLNKLYGSFGEKECISYYTTPLGLVSRCFQVADNLRLLAIHDDCDGAGGKSGYSDEHMKWVSNMLENARRDNCKVIAMEHHLLLHPFCKTVNASQSIADNFKVAEKFADMGLRLMFTGHSHMQRTTRYTSQNGNTITQINLGSLTGYPSPVTYVDFDGENAKIKVEFTDSFVYNEKEYTAEFFKKHTLGVLFNLLEAGTNDKTDFYERLAANGIKLPSYDLLYPIIRSVCKKLLKAECGKTGKLVNFVTFGKAIGKTSLEKIKNEPLLELVSKIFLAVFDGSYILQNATEGEKEVIADIGKLPKRIVNKLPLSSSKKKKISAITDDIEILLNELVSPAKPDNFETVIAL